MTHTMILDLPVERAAWSLIEVQRLYARAGRNLERDLANYLGGHGGYMVSRPDLLLMARPAVLEDLRAGEERWLRDNGQADAWYVHFLAGRGGLKSAVREMPYRLPWVCWYRNFRHSGGPVHYYRTETLIAKLRN